MPQDVEPLPAHQNGAHSQHDPHQHGGEGPAVDHVLFRYFHLLGHSQKQRNANEQKQYAADQIHRVGQVDPGQLHGPGIQLLFRAFQKFFQKNGSFLRVKSGGRVLPRPPLGAS